MRGDRPQTAGFEPTSLRFTPHARGSTLKQANWYLLSLVYPACAGIDPCLFPPYFLWLSLPRMRGDRPHDSSSIFSNSCLPRMRIDRVPLHSLIASFVYPACAIDPLPNLGHALEAFPACGGSTLHWSARVFAFVYPACVIDQNAWVWVYRKSLPACAGIDLFTAIMQRMACCLPRMRGDRPQPVCFSQDRIPFTPHARGSTSAKAAHALPRRVYPACAGIDLIIGRACKKN